MEKMKQLQSEYYCTNKKKNNHWLRNQNIRSLCLIATVHIFLNLRYEYSFHSYCIQVIKIEPLFFVYKEWYPTLHSIFFRSDFLSLSFVVITRTIRPIIHHLAYKVLSLLQSDVKIKISLFAPSIYYQFWLQLQLFLITELLTRWIYVTSAS